MRTPGDSSSQTIVWRRIDRPGHESSRIQRRGSQWWLEGTAVFIDEREPCRLDYVVQCDSNWQTQRCSVWGWVGSQSVDVAIQADAGNWSLGGSRRTNVDGAIDIDLNFSPSTNLLPIRRLELQAGQEATVRAAWLQVPTIELASLEQTYRRLDASRYRYEGASGFVVELDTDRNGVVTKYPGFWAIEEFGPTT